MPKCKYIVRKATMEKGTTELWNYTTIGYFKRKKDAIRFVENKDNVKMFENEYIHNKNILVMQITIETWDIKLEYTTEYDKKWIFE